MINSKIIIRRPLCGFFSDFLTALAGIMYCKDNGSNVYVDWVSDMYLGDNKNLFDSYFNNTVEESSTFDIIYDNLTPYGHYFDANKRSENAIYDMQLKPSIYLKELDILNNNFIKEIDIKTKFGLNGRVLGLHKRGTDLHMHGDILSNEEALKFVNEEFKKNSYDKIFVTTDDENSFNFFKNELGDSMIYNDSLRVSGNIGVHFSGFDKKEVARNVVTDAVLLSQCDFKLLTKSNISTFANISNLDKDNFRYTDINIHYE
jgi:hypothetical protein